MLGAGEVDALTLLVAGTALAGALAVAIRTRPRTAVVGWVVTVAFVPYWVGVSVGSYLPPATALAAVCVVALLARRPLRLRLPDAVVALVVLVTVLAYGLDFVTIHATFVVVMDWGTAYLLARLLCASVDPEWIYGVVAVVLAAAAVLAVLEFVTGTNVFVQIPPTSGAGTWRSLQERGGILRAEGAFGHSIALGASLALAVPLALGSRLRSGVKVAVVGALVAGAVVSFSRIGIGSTVLGLVLCILFLRNGLRGRVRALLVGALAVAAVLALPLVERVFSAAGDEAAGSAAYRTDLLVLLPSMRVIGTAASAERSADGVLRFGGFRSIDSALLYAGLTYGTLVMVVLAALYGTTLVGLVRGVGTAPSIALAAQVPAVLSVAFITQYSAFFWFVVGLAVSAHRAGDAQRLAARATSPAVPERVKASTAAPVARPSTASVLTLGAPGPVPSAASSPSGREGTPRRNRDPA